MTHLTQNDVDVIVHRAESPEAIGVRALAADWSRLSAENATLRYHLPDADRILAIHEPYVPGAADRMLRNEFAARASDDTELMCLAGMLDDAIRDATYPLRVEVAALRQVLPSAVGLEIVAGMLASDGHVAAADEMRQRAARIRDLDGLNGKIAADLARLRHIETAAREALASGQERYTHLADDGEYVGDLIPAAKMIALAEAVHGAQVVRGKPPAASDEYARELEAALFEGAGEVQGG